MEQKAPLVTTDIYKGVAERLLYGGVIFLTARLVANGYLEPEMASYLAGGAVTLFGGLWAWWVNRPIAIAQSAAALPNTQVITTSDIANSTKETNIVSTETVRVTPK